VLHTKYFKLREHFFIMPDKEDKLYSYEIRREGIEDVLHINYLGAPFVPSLSDYPEVMFLIFPVLCALSSLI